MSGGENALWVAGFSAVLVGLVIWFAWTWARHQREFDEASDAEPPPPGSYRRAPAVPEDDPAYPLSMALLQQVLDATQAGKDPYGIELDASDERRTKRAIAFTVDAIWEVRDRKARAMWFPVVGLGGFFLSFITPPLVGSFLGIAGALVLVIGGYVIRGARNAGRDLQDLAVSDEEASVLAERLRTIARWPPSSGDPLCSPSMPT